MKRRARITSVMGPGAVMAGSLIHVVTLDDVKKEHMRVLQAQNDLNAAVVAANDPSSTTSKSRGS